MNKCMSASHAQWLARHYPLNVRQTALEGIPKFVMVDGWPLLAPTLCLFPVTFRILRALMLNSSEWPFGGVFAQLRTARAHRQLLR